MTAGSAPPNAQRRLIGLLLVLLLLAQIDQPYPEVALLQHIPTMLLIVAAPWLLRRFCCRRCCCSARLPPTRRARTLSACEAMITGQ